MWSILVKIVIKKIFKIVWNSPTYFKRVHTCSICSNNVPSGFIWFNFHRIGPLGWFNLVFAMPVCVSVCLSPFHVLDFEAYFAFNSRSRMSNIFRDSEFLGKSAGKKWSEIWTFQLGNGLKSPCKKKFFLLILSYKTWWKPRFPMD